MQARWWVLSTKTGKNGEQVETGGLTTLKPADLKFLNRQLITVGFVPPGTLVAEAADLDHRRAGAGAGREPARRHDHHGAGHHHDSARRHDDHAFPSTTTTKPSTTTTTKPSSTTTTK